MKIISKQKDCYDYLTGIYGIDELKILDRRGWEKHNNDFLFPSFTSYYSDEYDKDNKCETRVFSILGIRYHVCYGENKKVWLKPDETKKDRKWGKLFRNKRKTSVNRDSRLPFVIHHYSRENDVSPIILNNYELAKVLSIDQVYKDLDLFLGWLNDNPEISNNQTNKNKIQSHGFDLKTSFRPKMKK